MNMNDDPKIKIGNLFSNLPEHIDEEIFETIVSSQNFRIEKIISEGQPSPDGYWYDQDNNDQQEDRHQDLGIFFNPVFDTGHYDTGR